MIKIIKQGIKPKRYKRIYNLTCENCTCEFEFEESDCTKVRHEKCINGEYRGEINCPFCSERLFVDFTTSKHRDEEIIEEPIDLGHIAVINEDINCIWSPSLCKCPKCGSDNTLRNDSFVLTTWPAQYNFKCKDCGHRWTGYDQILTNPKGHDPWDNGHCNNCPNKNQIGDVCSFCSHSPYGVTYNSKVEGNE